MNDGANTGAGSWWDVGQGSGTGKGAGTGGGGMNDGTAEGTNS